MTSILNRLCVFVCVCVCAFVCVCVVDWGEGCGVWMMVYSSVCKPSVCVWQSVCVCVKDTHTKDTHTKDTHTKETHADHKDVSWQDKMEWRMRRWKTLLTVSPMRSYASHRSPRSAWCRTGGVCEWVCVCVFSDVPGGCSYINQSNIKRHRKTDRCLTCIPISFLHRLHRLSPP